jgi:hypothetical protein
VNVLRLIPVASLLNFNTVESQTRHVEAPVRVLGVVSQTLPWLGRCLVGKGLNQSSVLLTLFSPFTPLSLVSDGKTIGH